MFTGKLKKQDGKLVYIGHSDEVKFKAFLKKLNEGDQVEVFMDFLNDDGSLAQLAKLHAMIRDLANFTGNSGAGMKLLIKQEAGLCFVKDNELVCKSFGDCSKDELGLAIQACSTIAYRVGLNF